MNSPYNEAGFISTLYYVEYYNGGWVRDAFAEVTPEALWPIYKSYRDQHRFVRIVKVVTNVAEAKLAEFQERYTNMKEIVDSEG